jgi:3-hydroxyisobutyrate dehydrogenase-like beta-hydroxyacid dehydrogenase
MADLRLGVVGLGAMGRPMAANLLAGGFPVAVLRHRDTAAPSALAAAGAGVVDSLAALVAAVDAIILMLPSSQEVEETVLGPDGLEGLARPGQVIVDMGTSDPASTRRLSERLASRGVDFLDAPVTGGVKGAAAGTLLIMAGGPPHALDRVRPALETLGSAVVHVGESGAGHTLKIINNLIAVTTGALIAEALRLAEAARLPLPVVLDVLQKGSANSAALQGMAGRIRSRQFDPGFRVNLARKDLTLAEGLARTAGVRLPVGAAARVVFDEACEAGLGDLDTSALAASSGPPQGRRPDRS